MFARIILAAATLAGCGVAAPAVTPTAAPERPPCTSWVVDGTPVVTFMATDPADHGCDVAPPTVLDIVYTADYGTPDAAAADCDHAGGTAEWTTANDWPRLICHDVDY